MELVAHHLSTTIPGRQTLAARVKLDGRMLARIGRDYPSAEHRMMASKGRLFKDEESLAKILDAPEPKTAKALGRKVSSFDSDLWNDNARRLATEGNIAKWKQNPHMRESLLRCAGGSRLTAILNVPKCGTGARKVVFCSS